MKNPIRPLALLLTIASGAAACTAPVAEEAVGTAEAELTYADPALVLSTAGKAKLECQDCLRSELDITDGDLVEVWVDEFHDHQAEILVAEQSAYEAPMQAGDPIPGFPKSEDIDAVHWGASYVLVSTNGAATIQGLDVKGGDLVRIETTSPYEASVVFVGAHHFKKGSTKIDALYEFADGRYALSIHRDDKVGKDEVPMRKGDVFVYDPVDREVDELLIDIESGVFKSSCTRSGRVKADKSEQIDGFHIHNGKYLVSTGGATHMGNCGTLIKYEDGDVIEFDPASPNTYNRLLFDEDEFRKNNGNYGANEEVDAITIRP